MLDNDNNIRITKLNDRLKNNNLFYVHKYNQKAIWTKEEDDHLTNLISIYGERKWKIISNLLVTRSPIQCFNRWKKSLRPGIIKGPWSNNEDLLLTEFVNENGLNNISKCKIEGRTIKQIKERWNNILNPNLNKREWELEEDYILFHLYLLEGGKWSKYRQYFDNRSDNSLKNRFYSRIRKLNTILKNNSFLVNLASENQKASVLIEEIESQLKNKNGGVLPVIKSLTCHENYENDFFNEDEELSTTSKAQCTENNFNDIKDQLLKCNSSTNYSFNFSNNNYNSLINQLDNLESLIKSTKIQIQDTFPFTNQIKLASYDLRQEEDMDDIQDFLNNHKGFALDEFDI